MEGKIEGSEFWREPLKMTYSRGFQDLIDTAYKMIFKQHHAVMGVWNVMKLNNVSGNYGMVGEIGSDSVNLPPYEINEHFLNKSPVDSKIYDVGNATPQIDFS